MTSLGWLESYQPAAATDGSDQQPVEMGRHEENFNLILKQRLRTNYTGWLKSRPDNWPGRVRNVPLYTPVYNFAVYIYIYILTDFQNYSSTKLSIKFTLKPSITKDPTLVTSPHWELRIRTPLVWRRLMDDCYSSDCGYRLSVSSEQSKTGWTDRRLKRELCRRS